MSTATAPNGIVHELADNTTTRCGLPAAGWSREVTQSQKLGLVLRCPDCGNTRAQEPDPNLGSAS